MPRRVEVDILGIARGILPAEVADVLRRDIPALVYRPVRQINQIQRRGEDEVRIPVSLRRSPSSTRTSLCVRAS